MSTHSQQTGSHHELLHEHAYLRTVLELVTETVAARQARPVVVAEMVSQAVEGVLEHFWCEERSGHLNVATERAPNLAVRAEALIREHEEMALQLRDIQRHTSAAEASTVWWQQLQDLWEQFLTRFEKHEDAENRLLQTAFTEDLGAID